MYHTVGIMKRSSLTVPFYKSNDEYTNWMKETYINTGKATRTVSLSIDGLTRTQTTAWATPEDEAEHNSHPKTLAMVAERTAYNQENKIQRIWARADGPESV